MDLLNRLKVKGRVAQRVGAFARAQDQGMSVEEARAYSNQLYPPTAEDIAYDERQRRVDETGSGFPWPSAVSLLYPIGATIYIATRTPAPIAAVAGYGLAKL